jgi:1,4-dihydroxy-6-naphthoate synthase
VTKGRSDEVTELKGQAGAGVTLTLAHSPDPDDVFMWWPITGMIEPPREHDRVEPARVVSSPEIDTGDLRFVPIAADISVLNRRAISQGDLDITAMSMNCYARVAAKYRLTSFGSSMGYGYGPKVVARVRETSGVASSTCYECELSAKDRGVRALLDSEALIAIPGRETTAFLVLSMMLGEDHARARTVEMPFDRILDAVVQGTGGVTHGLLIHQSQLTFAQMGVELIADVGEWWLKTTGLPLPLGGNAIRRDVDVRFGIGIHARAIEFMYSSIQYALRHRERSLEYCMRFAPEITRAQAERYIEMYVSDLTLDAGEGGRAAVERLLNQGAGLGLCPAPGPIDMAWPGRRPG